MRYYGTVITPYDGTLSEPEVEMYQRNGRVVVSLNGDDMAYLDRESHSLWRMNPGFRDWIMSHRLAISGGIIP